MRRTHTHRLIALSTLLAPSLLGAQSAVSPITHSLYVALGGDAVALDKAERPPLFVTAGVERGRADSPWSLRLGAEYRRAAARYEDTRWEDFAVAVTERYGRRSGTFRPYLLTGVGIADLRVRGRLAKYDNFSGPIYPPVDTTMTTVSRWNGLITSGLGTDVALGRLRLYTEARFNLYPARLSAGYQGRSTKGSKALYFGIKF